MRSDQVIIMRRNLRHSVIACQRHPVTAFRCNEGVTIGKRIRERRDELDLTLAELSKLCDVPPSTLSDIEHERQNSSTKLHKIADALGVHVSWLETGKGARLLSEKSRSAADESALITAHGVHVTLAGARLGAEWDKIEGDDYKKIARELIESLVAAQKRNGKRRKLKPEAEQLPA